jgi:hypothetical protein
MFSLRRHGHLIGFKSPIFFKNIYTARPFCILGNCYNGTLLRFNNTAVLFPTPLADLRTTLPAVVITDNFIFSILFCFVHIFVYWLGGCGLDSTGWGQGPVTGCCECGDGPSGSCATELVI